MPRRFRQNYYNQHQPLFPAINRFHQPHFRPVMQHVAEYNQEVEVEAVDPRVRDFDSIVEDGRFVFQARFAVLGTLRNAKIISPIITDTKGCEWRLMVFPFGNCNDTRGNLSMFLDLSNIGDKALDYRRKVKISFALLNLKDIQASETKGPLDHTFSANQSDYGYPKAFERQSTVDLPYEEDGRHLYLDGDGFVHVSVLVEDVDPPQTFGKKLKKQTGMVGLRNQGATCYMNSLLQTLYHITQLRKAVYDTPTADDDSVTGVALALQRLFYRLQTSDEAVGTKELTKSFGWETWDTLMQQDVQELNRVLMDRLESKMAGTPVEGMLKQLFEGGTRNYIKCVDVDYTSGREETYYDIQLDVKGCRSIYDSFDKFVAEEMLNGDNKYEAGEFGKQDAKKGDRFVKFPPVLTIHLKRFEFCMQSGNMTKVNDYHEFPKVIDIDKYLTDDVVRDPEHPNTYALHSVLVHSGDVHSGHYYAYIRPCASVEGGQWAKFDDEEVTLVEEEEAIQGSYGINKDEPLDVDPVNYWGMGKKRRSSNARSYTSAYMLVYIRISDLPTVMATMGADSIPAELSARFKKEEEDQIREKKERDEAHLYMTVVVAQEEDLSQASASIQNQDFAKWGTMDKRNNANTSLIMLKVKKQDTVAELYKTIARACEAPVARCRLWPCTARVNKTVRPDRPLVASDMSKLTRDVLTNDVVSSFNRITNDWGRVYLEVTPEVPGIDYKGLSEDEQIDLIIQGKAYPDLHPDQSLVFLKFYKGPDPGSNVTYDHVCIECCGTHVVNEDDKAIVLEHAFKKQLSIEINEPFLMFEQVTPGSVTRLDRHQKIKDLEIQHGDIVWGQRWAKQLAAKSSQQQLHLQETTSEESVSGTDDEEGERVRRPKSRKRPRLPAPPQAPREFQDGVSRPEHIHLPTVPDWFTYQQDKRVVTFLPRSPEMALHLKEGTVTDTNLPGVTVELAVTDTIMDVLEILALHMDLVVESQDPPEDTQAARIRLFPQGKDDILCWDFAKMTINNMQANTLDVLLDETSGVKPTIYFDVRDYSADQLVHAVRIERQEYMPVDLCDTVLIRANQDLHEQQNKSPAHMRASRILKDHEARLASIESNMKDNGSDASSTATEVVDPVAGVLPSQAQRLFERMHLFIRNNEKAGQLLAQVQHKLAGFLSPGIELRLLLVVGGYITCVLGQNCELNALTLDYLSGRRGNITFLVDVVTPEEQGMCSMGMGGPNSWWMPLQVMSFSLVHGVAQMRASPMLTYVTPTDTPEDVLERVFKRRTDLPAELMRRRRAAVISEGVPIYVDKMTPAPTNQNQQRPPFDGAIPHIVAGGPPPPLLNMRVPHYNNNDDMRAGIFGEVLQGDLFGNEYNDNEYMGTAVNRPPVAPMWSCLCAKFKHWFDGDHTRHNSSRIPLMPTLGFEKEDSDAGTTRRRYDQGIKIREHTPSSTPKNAILTYDRTP